MLGKVARAVRRRLDLIRYYSAIRPRTAWTRARDVALAAALVAAWPTAWLLDRACVARAEEISVVGKLFESATGRVWAWVPPPPLPPPDLRGEDVFHGSFEADLVSEDRGWPFASSAGLRAARLRVEVLSPPRTLRSHEVPRDSPIGSAVATALLHAGREPAIGLLWPTEGRDAPAVSHRVASWVANGIIWSVLLPIAAWITISMLRLGALLAALAALPRRHQRLRADRCADCGYDLRANLFSERCPECGAILG